MAKPTAHPDNVPGDFYVADGCCLLCGVPEAHAPEFFGWVGGKPYDEHCFIARQPQTPAEIKRLTEAMGQQCMDCIRYRGRNRTVQKTLVASGDAIACDHLAIDIRFRRWASAGFRRLTRRCS